MLPVSEPADVTDPALRHPGQLRARDLVPCGGRGGAAADAHRAHTRSSGQRPVTCKYFLMSANIFYTIQCVCGKLISITQTP